MTGRSLHDSLLKVVSDASLRTRLLTADRDMPSLLGEDEAAVLARVPAERLIRMSRFLARHYYRERIVRLFRHVRVMAQHTRRDPLVVLDSAEGLGFLDSAVLGSSASVERLLSLLQTYLTEADEEIVAVAPYWRDLVRYQTAMVRAEAASESGQRTPNHGPRRSGSVQILDLEWDIPAVVAELRKGVSLPAARAVKTSVIVARTRHGRITVLRCSTAIRKLLEAADGTRDASELSRSCGLSREQVELLMRQLSEIGALA